MKLSSVKTPIMCLVLALLASFIYTNVKIATAEAEDFKIGVVDIGGVFEKYKKRLDLDQKLKEQEKEFPCNTTRSQPLRWTDGRQFQLSHHEGWPCFHQLAGTAGRHPQGQTGAAFFDPVTRTRRRGYATADGAHDR